MTLSETTSFTDQEHAQELFDSLNEDGHDSDEMKEFIEEHGHKDFLLYMRITPAWLMSSTK